MNQPDSHGTRPKRKRYVKAVGPRLQKLLALVLGLFALLVVNSIYLVAVRVAGWSTGEAYENLFYLNMFLVHLLLGALIVVPVLVFGVLHIKNSYNRPNRRAVKVGYALFAAAVILLASGIVLTRIEGVIVVQDATVRAIAYWTHVVAPILCVWLFVLHRLAGRRIRWKVGIRWGAVAAVFAGLMLIWQSQDPRKWNEVGNPDGAKYFFPSLARTVSGDFIPADILQNDAYCARCHEDVHDGWEKSAHRFASFSNPAYLASVRETREFAMERDGNVNAARFCAGCHDVVPFFSGAFNDPNYDMENDPTASAGVTCTACHAISKINSPRGNADYTIDVPIHYPFAFSDVPFLQWINEQLVKAKPEFHKKTFLKPLHKTTEFCGTCHKVHLPPELNDYKWLRGQNHQDAFWLSGVSGHGIQSFYYPPKAEQSCNACHMKPFPSENFSARVRDESGVRKTLDHLFPSSNTAVPMLAAENGLLTEAQAHEAVEAHRRFNEGVMRVDIFGVKEEGRIDGELTAPLRPAVPSLVPGRAYLIEVVIRTVKMGHVFTQGTADSNEVWLDVTATSGGETIGRSGAMSAEDRAVDPWSHFVNAFVIDRNGDRINRRNPQDIFTPLYSNQIPPGAADVVHYLLEVPPDAEGSITFDVKLRYRKFDTEYMQFVRQDSAWKNDLPILELAQDRVTFPVAGGAAVEEAPEHAPVEIPLWQRWNDYGIGLLRKGGQGELRQAEGAFREVEALGRPDGPLNLARVYLREGRVSVDAPEALRRARDFDPPANEWSVLFYSAMVNKQNSRFDEAIDSFEQIIAGGFEQAVGKGFDFSKDYTLLVELANTLYERAKQERGDDALATRRAFLERAIGHLEQALVYDPELASAHYNLKLIHADLGNEALEAEHAALHDKYRPDDNARDRAISLARSKYPAANHAAEAIVIYDLDR
ncbi:MAG: multiheme c-type cytochrome [Planctomycetota bacterium]